MRFAAYSGSSLRTHDAPSVPSWRDFAACRGRDLTLWFAPESSFETQVALRVCATCPVRAACLAAALDEECGVDFGIYGVRGGQRPSERRALGRLANELDGNPRRVDASP